MEYHTICITNCKLNSPINANHKRKCETNRSSAYHITPKRGKWMESIFIFFLPTFNAWRRNWGIHHLCWNYDRWIISQQLWITNYALWINHDTHVRASLRGLDSPDAWIFPTIMHYELWINSCRFQESWQFQIIYLFIHNLMRHSVNLVEECPETFSMIHVLRVAQLMNNDTADQMQRHQHHE